ncbi:MAG: hypothetical protein MUE74_03080 [Bacteroidales bacterium]|nr:hypothetical protein [Bacteroidales bacterium]
MNLYDQGKVDSTFGILSSCINDDQPFRKTTRNTKAEIYRLYALSAVLLDKPDDARSGIEHLLRYRPYYRNDFHRDDLVEFRRIVTDFTVQPKIVLGVKYFMDFPEFSIEKNLTSHSNSYVPEITFSSESGWGIVLENSFSKNLYAGIGLNILYMDLMYRGSPLPFQEEFSYNIPLRYLETPLFVNYKLRIGKKLIPHLQAGLIGRYPVTSEVARLKSSEYGGYYMVNDYGNLAVFMENYEYLDFSLGGGVKYSFKKSCLDLNIISFPFHFNHNALKNINTFDDLPQSEAFVHADEIILLEIKKRLRIELCYKYYLNFKAF